MFAYVTHFAVNYLAMVKKKTATLNLRVDPIIKEAIRDASERQHRSIANMIEILIREHCKAEGFPVAIQSSLFEASKNE
jgi:hypothetical protein|tara:strand:- start:268 stop:504 length:237 start_codon:yes stop_codon:yes gene_type:complete